MYSIEPVKDQSYTLKDLLMKKGQHKMPDGSIMNDEDHLIKKGKRPVRKQPIKKQPLKKKAIIKKAIQQRPTQQIIQRTNVIVNQADDKPKRRPIRRRIQQPQKQQLKSQLPPYSISTGASGASFTPFYPPAPLYRNMVIASPPTTNDDMSASDKRVAQLRTGNMLNNIEKQTDKLNPLEKIEQVIINQDKPIITESKENDDEEAQPPSFQEAIGNIEYKTQDEKKEIERIKIEYETGLTLKNQKRREAYAKKKISQLDQMRVKIVGLEKQQTELLLESNRMNEEQKKQKVLDALITQSEDLLNRMNEEQKQQVINDMNEQTTGEQTTGEQEPTPKKERKQRRTKQEKEEERMIQSEKRQKERVETQKAYDDFSEAYDNDPDEQEKIMFREIIKGNSSSSDENMSSRVQALKRGHIVPMLARYI